MPDRKSRPLVGLFWALTALCFAAAGAMTIWYTPLEATMGMIQKIFYIHLPAAILTLLTAMCTFAASIGYLTTRRTWWDDLGAAAARMVIQLCAIVLVTGMIWGKSAWGQWWTWSPRLTFTLLMFLLYLVYIVLRLSIESSQRRAMVCAVYGIIAFLDVPLVYLSVKLMPDIHPSSIQLAPPMRWTLLAWAIPMTMMAAGLLLTRFSLNRQTRALEQSRAETANGPLGGLQSIGGLS